LALEDVFADPPSAYRGKPFWAWNGELEEGELRRQIRVFNRMGLGGAFMHSRVGLATPYLSEEWFDLVNACVDEAASNDMEAWLYDEDRWPSGAAGGLVTREPRYRRRELHVTVADPRSFESTGEEPAIFLARIEGSSAHDVRRATSADLESAPEGEKALVFEVKEEQPSPWYNGQTYLDTMSQEAVAKFIEVTHDQYARHVGEHFGSAVPGIFTDEPNYGRFHYGEGSGNVPWTDSLPSVFEERYGQDLIDDLPSLFFRINGEDFSLTRLRYFDCITHLFTGSFAGQVGSWCEEHVLLFTGHVLAEENLLSQTSVVGSAMRFYEHMQAPGIDILRGEGLEREGGMDAEIATAKQCSSVKHQFGRRWMLSELYGCTGWNFTLGEQKAVGDWQAVLGVNLRCQHLSWYTMLGQAKRDYPASISFQSPWWRDYDLVEDYFSRVNVLTTVGEPVRDIAVIHPIESAWGAYCAADRDSDVLWELNGDFEKLQRLLLRNHYDFDYVDEEILARHGGAEDGRLVVGEAGYRAVIVPPTLTLRTTTLQILDRAMEAGCQVIFISPVSTRADGGESNLPSITSAKCTVVKLGESELVPALRDLEDIRRVSLTDTSGEEYGDSLYMLRQDGDGKHIVYLVHTRQRGESGPLELRIPATGRAEEWDPVSGRIVGADARPEDGSTLINTHLGAYGSRLFVIRPEGGELPAEPEMSETQMVEIDPDRWRILRDEPNAIPLDVGEYRIGDGDWSGPLEVLKMDAAVRDVAGWPHRGGRMVQPWVRKGEEGEEGIEISLRFTFEVERIPDGPCHLVVERPDRYRITLNGKPIGADEGEGWWIDPSLERVRVPPGCLTVGENIVLLKTRYAPHHGIESLYLTGEFGARREEGTPVLTEVPEYLQLGDWAEAGFPAYSGSMTYVTDFEIFEIAKGERTFLEIPGWDGTLVKVRVNNMDVGRFAWPPYEAEVTPAVREGWNRLEIEVVSSRRNLLGPLHLKEKYPKWVGPGQFETEGDEWTDEYVTFEYGLTEPPRLSVRRAVER